MYRFLVILLIFAACSSEQPKTDATASTTPKEYGVNIFRKNCISCHGATGDMGFNGAADLTKSTLSIEERVAIITNGKKAMTPFKGILSAEEIQLVAEYTESLKK